MLLKSGDVNANVGIWQQFLVSQGTTTVTVDNSFGPVTKTATEAFQRICGLAVDGMAGPATIAAAQRRGFTGFSIAPVLTTKIVHTPAESHIAMFPGDRRTQINSAMLSKLAPVIQRKGQAFVDTALTAGTLLQIVQGLRTFTEQDALYAEGRSAPGKIVTNARGGQSLHNYSLAIDCAVVINGVISWDDHLYAPFGGWAKAVGLEWGGGWAHFKDLPHEQYTKGMNLGRIQALFRQGGLAGVWNAVQ